MISRDTRLSRMPLWFIDTPSETEMVVNGTGTPPPAATPSRAASACGRERHRAGRVLALRADDPDLRLVEVVVVEAAGAQEGAMRRAVEAFDGDARAVFGFFAHGRFGRVIHAGDGF